jgi:arylsulfatase A-like enzyme
MPAYMGLIKQIDDQLGILFAALQDRGLADNTMIVFTSDHGDYLGDHWLGEKDLFHECSVRVPLIIADPSPSADPTRGTISDSLVQAIDLAPTFLDFFGATSRPHILEGASLQPLLHGITAWPRRFVVSEYDYSMQDVRRLLGRAPPDCRLFMLFDGRWKYIHAPGFRPMLYDLQTDPDEFFDLGDNPTHAAERARLREALLSWALDSHAAITMPAEKILAQNPTRQRQSGILIGFWDEAELRAAQETDRQ